MCKDEKIISFRRRGAEIVKLEIRKVVTIVEDILSESGIVAERPLRRIAV